MPTLLLAALAVVAANAPAADPSPEQIFATRIQPIFNSPNPSSCLQCHLAGVDLKQYLRPTHRETFLSLRDQGMIDLATPSKSRILSLIQRGQGDPGAKLIHEKARSAEYAAFAAWVTASAADPELRNAPKLAPTDLTGPPKPSEIIRHARTDRLLASFENTIWAMRFRCMSCHVEGSAENKKLTAEYGPRVAWLKSAGPLASLTALLDSKLIDVNNPAASLLLTKPLNKVKHEGGQKFLMGDEGYKAFRAFVDDVAAIRNDKYATAADLPKPPAGASFGTDIWIKFEKTPPTWGDKLVAVKLFAWDSAKNEFESEPIASTDRKVWGGGKLWQHNLTLHAAKGSDRAKSFATAPKLPAGKYLARVYLDATDKLAKDWTATLDATDFVGQVEVKSDWPVGYGKMTVLDAGRVHKE